MRTRRFLSTILAAALMFGIWGQRLSAHHSVAGYDTSKTVDLRGIVTEYKWKNPHVFLVWAVKDKDGKVVEWAGEMNSTTSMIQVGMSKNSLKPGDDVIVTIHPSKTGNPVAVIRKIVTADGKLIVDRFIPQ